MNLTLIQKGRGEPARTDYRTINIYYQDNVVSIITLWQCIWGEMNQGNLIKSTWFSEKENMFEEFIGVL